MNIALIADDAKKTLMQNLCIAYKNVLSSHELYATGSTGRLIEEFSGLRVNKFLFGIYVFKAFFDKVRFT